MPIYEYECKRCGHRFELLQKFSDKPRSRCPECRGAVERLISPPAIRFKGTGWYVTDYADKKQIPEKAEGKGSDADSKSTATEGTKADKSDKSETRKKEKKAS